MFRVLTIAGYILITGANMLAQNPHDPPSPYSGTLKTSFIRTWNAAAPESNSGTFITRPVRDVKQATVYMDGMGRILQTVIKEGSLVTGAIPVDMINAEVYDDAGREQYKYLPFASTASDATKNNGLFKLNPFQQQIAFYNTQLNGQTGETNVGPNSLNWAYGQTKFEASPLNRTEEAFNPGSSWVGTADQPLEANRHSVRMKYWNNNATDAVRLWTVTNAPMGSFGTYSSSGVYADGILFKIVTVDEMGKQVIEFKDKAGKVILKKVQLTAAEDNGSGSSHTGWLCTYYIYDELGNLRCIITPRAVELISSNWLLTDAIILAEQCYRYEYDTRNRMIMKRTPGADEEYMVYDNHDRLVMTQDANMRASNPKKWIVALYDKFNRPVQTGLWDDANSLSYHVGQASTTSATDYPFSVSAIPGSGYERLTQTGYDGYITFPTGTGVTTSFDNTYTNNSNYFFTTYNASPEFAQSFTVSNQTRGMVTWTETKILNSNPVTYMYTVNIYDDKGRIIQVKSKNITGGIDILTTQYNWIGQPLIIMFKQEKAGSPAQTSIILKKMSYDDMNRIIQVDEKVQNTLVNSNILPAVWSSIKKNEYDALSQLKTKKIGGKKDPVTGNYTGIPIETLTHDYNIRGWLLGVNRSYLSVQGQTSDGIHFGFELGYDKLTNQSGQNFGSVAQFNGNITGMLWKSDGDDIRRKYDFYYDAVNQMMKADFKQQNPDDNLWNSNQINYSINMGDGAVSTSAYDANGNIKSMTQFGYKLGGNPQTPIDQLTYNYMFNNTSNRLLNVIDGGNDAQTKLGDFRTSLLHPTQVKNSTTIDYTYDLNGNLLKDYNKDIHTYSGGNGIVYNHLNLPQAVTFKKDGLSDNGTITYTYDASGNKIKKTILENSTTVLYNGTNYNTSITTITIYIAGFVYETRSYSNSSLAALAYVDRLLFISHEEGRIRFKQTDNTFHYDYFIRDHLGNVRMVLTEETAPASIYQASIEDANRSNEIQLFTQIPETESLKPEGFDSDGANQKVSKLFNVNGTDKRVGPGVVLKVMAGDKFKALVNGWYLPNGTNINSLPGAPSIIGNILNAFTGGLPGGSKYTSAEITGSGVLNVPVGDFLTYQSGQTNSNLPKAYLNWMILDEEQFKLVTGNYGVVQIPEITGTMQKQVMQAASGAEIEVKRNGYLYVYVSNESQGSVYFDDLRVEHTRGSLTEETHYYPVGLQMAGISSHALFNAYLYNDFKYQGQEYEGGMGLNMLEFEARMYDLQLGRWHVPDPANQFASPYSGMGNNWPIVVDPDGRVAWFIPIMVGAIIGATTSAAVYTVTAGSSFTWSGFGKAVAFGAVGGAIAGGFSAIGTALNSFGQSLAYNIFSNVASTVGTNVAFGNEITLGTIVGSVAGGLLGGAFGNFSGVKGGAFVNAIAEVGYNSLKGSITGAFTGGLASAIDGNDVEEGIVNGATYGAIGGAVSSGLMIVTFGAAIKPNETVSNKITEINKHFGISNKYGPVFRRGGLYEFFSEIFSKDSYARGVAWGRNLIVPYNDETETFIHEYMHFVQQIKTGFGNMQGKGIIEQLKATFSGFDPYKTPGTNEFQADYWTRYFLGIPQQIPKGYNPNFKR